MDDTKLYIALKYNHILDYHIKNKHNKLESSTKLAREVAKRLIKEGKKPRILEFLGPLQIFGMRKEISHRTFQNKIYFGGHYVACAEGYVYDPFIGYPITLDDYSDSAFFGEVEFQLFVPEPNINKFIGK